MDEPTPLGGVGDAAVLRENLARYRTLAIDLGATDAAIISVAVFDCVLHQ